MNKYEAQIPSPPAAVVKKLKKMVRFDIADAGSFCGIDSIRAFQINQYPEDTPESFGNERKGNYSYMYNRREGILVNIENFFSTIDRMLIGKPAIVTFVRPIDYKGGYHKEFQYQELMDMFDKDERCHRVCDWLNRTGPHEQYPNHLRLYYYLGTHEEPEDMK